jgi:hypothetical protein
MFARVRVPPHWRPSRVAAIPGGRDPARPGKVAFGAVPETELVVPVQRLDPDPPLPDVQGVC